MRGGIHPNFNKSISTTLAIKPFDIPSELIIPFPDGCKRSDLIVEVGDRVLAGQALTRTAMNSDTPVIHASSSGVVSAIAPAVVPHPSGLTTRCVFIKTDGRHSLVNTTAEAVVDLSREDLLSRIQRAGVLGLGGAAFSSYIKVLSAKQQGIHTLIINAAECEPYISCDDQLIRERVEDIIKSIQFLMELLSVSRCKIGIEDNKPESIHALVEALDNITAAKGEIHLEIVPTQYPSGDSRQLTKLLTGKEVAKGEHSLASGVLMHNVATVLAIHEAAVLNQPQIKRIVTVTGDGVKQARNVEVLIGTPISFVVKQLGGYSEKAERLIMGGPLMGFPLASDDMPIIKATNCILATSLGALSLASESRGSFRSEMPCIRCNQCADACPVNLLPQQLYWYAKARDFEKTMEHNLSDCIECGVCSYVCPSTIPLVDYFKFAKSEVRSQRLSQQKASKSRERYEFNEHRKIRIKEERELRRRQHKEALAKKQAAEEKKVSAGASTTGNTSAANAKQDAIKAAMERAKAKKAALKAAAAKGDDKDAI